jgi:hypothetical protein
MTVYQSSSPATGSVRGHGGSPFFTKLARSFFVCEELAKDSLLASLCLDLDSGLVSLDGLAEYPRVRDGLFGIDDV